MKKKTFQITPKALPYEKVMVENYRSRYKPWEEGKIMRVEVALSADGSYHISYDVILDRRRVGRSEGKVIWLYVNDTQIKNIIP